MSERNFPVAGQAAGGRLRSGDSRVSRGGSRVSRGEGGGCQAAARQAAQ